MRWYFSQRVNLGRRGREKQTRDWSYTDGTTGNTMIAPGEWGDDAQLETRYDSTWGVRG